MKILVTTLSNGVEMPMVGLGTYGCDSSDVILKALNYGYAAVDTAEYYGTYPYIQKALEDFEKSRSPEIDCPATKTINPVQGSKIITEKDFHKNFEIPHGNIDSRTIFLTTKCWPPLSASKVKESAERFFDAVKIKQGDLYMLHWPGVSKALIDETEIDDPDTTNNHQKRLEAWREMECQYSEGKFRAIGVSNFMVKHLQPLIEDIEARQKAGDNLAQFPMVNQIEISPWVLPDKNLVDFCAKYNVKLEAYSPIGSARKVKEYLSHDTINQLAQKYDKSPAVIILRSLMERGFIVIPKSGNPQRVIDNYQIFDFTLEKCDLDLLEKNLNKGLRACTDPNTID